MSPPDFIAAIAPAAVASMAATRIPASFVIAEGALESAWGASQLALQAHNLFGVKADAGWHGAVLAMRTREIVHGHAVIVPANWRSYPDWASCIADHAAFLQDNPRYHAAFAQCAGAEAFTRAVAAAGYATDPDYAGKIIAVIRAHDLTRYDRSPA